MYEFTEKVREELANIDFLLKESKKHLDKENGGSLVKRVINGHEFFYCNKRRDGKVVSRYLGTESDERLGEFIYQLLLEKRLVILNNDRSLLMDLIKEFEPYDNDAVLSKVLDSKGGSPWGLGALRELIAFDTEHVEASDEPGAGRGSESDKPFARGILTCDGNRVRSKGECIWYDSLLREGVPFRYEPTLYLDDEEYFSHKVNPDFMVDCDERSCKNGVMVIEHYGLLDDKAYVESQARKLQLYHRNGFDLGHNLIVTSDNEDGGIDSSYINDLINGVIKKRLKY